MIPKDDSENSEHSDDESDGSDESDGRSEHKDEKMVENEDYHEEERSGTVESDTGSAEDDAEYAPDVDRGNDRSTTSTQEAFSVPETQPVVDRSRRMSRKGVRLTPILPNRRAMGQKVPRTRSTSRNGNAAQS
jgi:hypothetical protein